MIAESRWSRSEACGGGTPAPTAVSPPSPSSATSATTTPTTMASSRRPLPTPPVALPRADWESSHTLTGLPGGHPDLYAYGSPCAIPAPYPYYADFSPTPPVSPQYDAPSSTLRGGTLLHKGFYDLLAFIPSSASPSRLLWPRSQNQAAEGLISGPRYEEIPSNERPKPLSPPTSPVSSSPRNLKARRISKDMVSKPTGFVYVHCTCSAIHPINRCTVVTSFMHRMPIKQRRYSPAGVLTVRANWAVRPALSHIILETLSDLYFQTLAGQTPLRTSSVGLTKPAPSTKSSAPSSPPQAVQASQTPFNSNLCEL